MSKTHPLFYQSRSGHIRIGYGTASTTLTRQQIDELRIDVYSLEAFDYDDFLKAYSTPDNSKIPACKCNAYQLENFGCKCGTA